MLEVDELAVGRGARPVLEGLSFRVDEGACLAIAGPSGAGKSTLLRALAYLDDPHAGTLRLDGRSPEELGVPQWRRRVQLMPQRPVLLGGTVLDELRLPFTYRSVGGGLDEERARALLADLGIGGTPERRGQELSVGQQQRVAFARALLLRPRVLLLDEPTGAHDATAVSRVEAAHARQREDDGLALILVTHDEGQRRRLADRTLTVGE
ncbi:MAG: ATP-binding cassette domain-containing protein [Sandaracinaceae bacterium]